MKFTVMYVYSSFATFGTIQLENKEQKERRLNGMERQTYVKMYHSVNRHHNVVHYWTRVNKIHSTLVVGKVCHPVSCVFLGPFLRT